jgi:tRNA (cmo5U34)-methyltransferase
VDNTTSHRAVDYEAEVARTIPFHGEILDQAVDAALATHAKPARWLDTGCGPGRLVEKARALCAAEFSLADPSPAMLAIARARHPDIPEARFHEARSDNLPDAGPFDVITAIQCHHYYENEAGRARAVARCFALLAPGGVFVAFENVRAATPAGGAIARTRWSTWLRGQGRSEPAVEAQLAREGTHFFPIRVDQHERILGSAGFATVELIWRAYSQAGFLCVKGSPV